METKECEKRRQRPRIGFVIALMAVIWFAGGLGWVTRSTLLALLPREGKGVRIEALGTWEYPDPATGIVVRVDAPRLLRFADEALGWKARLIPRGTIPVRLSAVGSVRVKLDEDAEEVWVPFVAHIQPNMPHPYVRVRLPSSMVNQALRYDDSFARRDKRRSYALGHYNIIHALRFDTVVLHSVPARRRPITFRRIEGEATGNVRFKLKENWFSARSQADIRKMTLRCDLDFSRYTDGIALAYKITIPKMDANIRNLASIFEAAPVEAVRKALENSIARPRNLEKLARRRLPAYIPLDTEVDIEVFTDR